MNGWVLICLIFCGLNAANGCIDYARDRPIPRLTILAVIVTAVAAALNWSNT